jgi:diaminopimelate decarboxylase/aspartate kinase
VGENDGETGRVKEPDICHKARKDLRAGFFLSGDCLRDAGIARLSVNGMQRDNIDTWWLEKREALLAIAGEHLNAYVYDLDTIRSAARRMRALRSVSRVLYAVKANFNADVIRTLADAGIDFDCVSPGEVRRLREVLGDDAEGRILFTPNFAPRDEYEWGLREGLRVTLDNLYPLRAWPELFAGKEVFIRIDPDQGGGHHRHVVTVGSASKFGVSMTELDELESLVADAGAIVTGIHAHSGSGITDPANWQAVAEALVEAAGRFPGVRVLDLGGGLGVPARHDEVGFDLATLDAMLAEFRGAHPDYELWLEPGRYLVSEAGVLLAHVTQTKGKSAHRYVGLSTGMNSLIRPALYDAWHEIVNLTRMDDDATETVTVVGPICETGDKLGTDRNLPPSRENDVVLIANAGAYGYVMSSRYNLRDIPPEIAI